MFVPILVIEDDGVAAATISRALGQSGFCPVVAPSAHYAVVLARQLAPQLVVLSLSLREADGLRVLHALRHNGYRAAVLAVAGSAQAVDEARRAGADDVLVRPVIARDLVARARTLGTPGVPRREAAAPPSDADEVFRFDGLCVSAGRRTVVRDGTVIPLGARELDLFVALLRRRGAVASRRELLREVWGSAPDGDPRLVDRHIMELRRRIEPDPAVPRYVLTVWKAGYRCRGPDESHALLADEERSARR